MSMKKIIVACGTGIATSTVITIKIKEALKAHGIDADVVQCKVSEVESKLPGTDMVVTTTNYTTDKVPCLRAISFLTGVGMEADIQKIVEVLK